MNFKFRFLPVVPCGWLPMLTLLLTLALSLSARAATYVVNDIGGDQTRDGCLAATQCTLPGAVTAAKNDDENSAIVFDERVFADKQTITLAGNSLYVPEGQKLSITGPAAGVIVFADLKSSVFNTAKGAEATLTGLTISGGKSIGNNSALGNDGTMTLTDMTFSGNTNGAISNEGTMTIDNCLVTGNSDKSLGAGLQNTGKLTINNSTFTHNSTRQGAGINNQSPGTLTLSNSVVRGNSASDGGGGIYNSGKATITDSTIADNSSGYGGGIANQRLGTLTLHNSTLSGNSATKQGGGIYISEGAVMLNNSTLAGNSAPLGGGIYRVSSRNTGLRNTLSVSRSTLAGNSATEQGGGIYCYDDSVITLIDSIIAGNAAPEGANISGVVADESANNISDGSAAEAGLDPAGLKDNGGPAQTIALLAGGKARLMGAGARAATD